MFVKMTTKPGNLRIATIRVGSRTSWASPYEPIEPEKSYTAVGVPVDAGLDINRVFGAIGTPPTFREFK